MNLGSKFNKVKQQASYFLRGDKTDVIGTLREAEDKADELRILSDAISRSLEKRLFTYNVTDEKKLSKVPELQASELLKEGVKEVNNCQTSDQTEESLFRRVVQEAATVEKLLGNILIDYEEQVGREVLPFLHNSLKDDFPSLSKQKKALKQAGQDLDAAKARLRNSLASNTGHAKVDNQRYEVDEAESKLEQIKDIYACDLFTTLSHQREVARLTCLNMELKLDFLQRSVITLNALLPPIQRLIKESPSGPVYSVPLHEHLRITQRNIALPIEACVKRLIEVGLREEGLFRIAGSATKVKKLRAAFDAGIISPDTLSVTGEYDVHVVAGALKSYLRDLPQPLLTHALHDQWTDAARKPDHDERLRALWQVTVSLPQPNLRNLVYAMKFLALLAGQSAHNKMTANNIAIVMAPNLIWTQRYADDPPLAVALGRDMNLTGDYRVIVEQMIEYCGYFFREAIDFGVQPLPADDHEPADSDRAILAPHAAALKAQGHRRNNSSSDLSGGLTLCEEASEHDSPRQPQRNKKKQPAPKPPALLKKVDVQQSADSTPEISPPNLRRSHSPPAAQIAPTVTQPKSQPYIRRPTEEPPLPPVPTLAANPRPPRPHPPCGHDIGSGDSKMNNVVSKDDRHKSSENVAIATESNNVEKTSESTDLANPEDSSDLQVCLRESTAASSEFRKSLEGILKHPQPLPRHLTRMSTSYTDGATADLSPVKLGIPVAAQRSFRKNQPPEKIEQAGLDKPIIPGKPNILLSRPADTSRPLVPEKPSSLITKPSAKSTNDIESVSSKSKVISADTTHL